MYQKIFRHKVHTHRWLFVLAAMVYSDLAAQAVNLVQEFYLPMPEAQLLQGIETASSAVTDTNYYTINSILTTGNGTVIYYDQWEDGYEPNLANPTQPTTQVWGDGDDANGICPGFAHDPVGIPAGTVITLTNAVFSKPRNPGQIYYDGGDRIAANKALVVTRAGWPSPTGPVAGGAAVVVSTLDFGTNFVSPIGQDMVENLFNYVGFFVMASADNTTVTIDLDGPGPTPPFTVMLNRGQSYLVNGGVMKGATIITTKPAEANLVCDDTVNSYAYDWFTLYPQSEWSSSYFTPVPSSYGGATLYTTINYFYNANANPITILYTNLTGSGSFTVPANGGNLYAMPTNSGASFTSAGGEVFTVLTTVAADPTNNPTAATDTTYNWGYTPLPKGSLTTEADVGWAPGSSDFTINGSPVWVTPVANTTIYVVYRGTNTPLTDPAGNKYSTNFTLSALQSKPIYVPGTNDQTGMKIYTLDNTLISVAWGEDPATAPTGNPGLDLGTSVLPFPVPLVKKSAIIVTDTPPAGLSVGDTIQYTVETDNKGLLPLGNTVIIDAPSASLQYVPNSTTLNGFAIPDSTNGFPLSTPGYTIPIILSQGISKFQYLAQVTGAGGVSNTVNIGGTSITATNALPPGWGAPAPAVSVFKTLMTPVSGTAVLGQTVQFNLQIIDSGNTILPSLSLSDNFPTNGLSFVSASTTPSAVNGGTLTWNNLGDFLPGQSTNITVQFVSIKTNSVATNTATATSVGGYGGNATNTGSAIITLGGLPTPGMTVNKSVLAPVSGEAGIGQTVQYNLQFVNSGTTTLTNVALADNFPGTNYSFLTASLLPNTNSGSRLTWTNIGTFAPGQFTNIAVSFTVTNYSARLTNVLIASSSISSTNNVAIAMTPGALTITKTILTPTNPANWMIGSNITFRILIQNTGRNAVRTLPLEDTFSGGVLQFVSATTPPNSASSGDLYWTNLTAASTLVVGATITNDVTMTIIGGPALTANTVAANFAIDSTGAAIAPASGTVSFNVAASGITGTVYNDVNQSGIFTAGDTPLSGVTFSLYSVSNAAPVAFIQSVVSDASGNFQFLNLSTGAYSLVESLLPGYFGSAPTNNSIFLNLTALASTNVNFFQCQLSPTNLAAVNGTVWNDVNGTGFFQAGDTGIANVEVDLLEDLNTNGIADLGDPLVQAVFTGTNGTYTFGGVVPGNYVIRELVLSNYVATSPAQLGRTVAAVVTNGNDFFNFFIGSSYSNSPPAAVPDFVTTLVNVPITIWPLTNDSSPGGFALTITNVAATNGIASVIGGTNVLFTPAANFSGTATIGYTVTNVNGKSTSLITITVQPLADLAIGKSAPATVFAGSNLIYTISVSNLGPLTASSVTVTDSLPIGTSFASASGGGANNSGTVTWNLGDLSNGAISNVTLTVTAPISGTLTNSASVGSPTSDPNSTNNLTPPVVTSVTPQADLSITKLAPANILATSNLSYMISVTNFGPSSASSVVVTDTLPAGATFVSASGSAATNAGVVVWSLGTLASGQSSNLALIVTAPASGTLTNIATVSSPTSDPISTNNTTPPVITSVTPAADLAIGKTGATSGVRGANFSYTISVTNFGPSAAANFSVTDSLPAGIIFVSSVPVTTTNAANQVIWSSLGALAANAATNFTLTVQATSRASFTNIATVGGPTLDNTTTNNTSSPVVTSITNRPPIAVNDTNSTARNVAVTIPVLSNDSDPDGDLLTIVSVNPTNGITSISGTNIIYTPTNTVPGTNIFSYTVTDGFGGTNSAFIIVYVTNRPPVALNDITNTAENISVAIPVLVNDSDPDGDALTIISTASTNGTAVISGTNIVFTPQTNFIGTAWVGYQIRDNFGGTNGALVTITITNIPPTANHDNFAITENTTNSFAVLLNDNINTSGGSLSLVSVSTTNGTAAISGTNIIFTPAANYLGSLTLNYTITDNVGGTNSSYVTVLVTNIPPLANPDSYSMQENSTNTFTPLVNDSVQTPGGALQIISVNTTNGTAAILNLTNVVFTPASNFVGTATINYTITDSIGGTNSSVITVTVLSVADLAVSKSGPASVYAATNFSYFITVTNFGPGPAASLSVTDNLPATVSFVSSSAGATLNGSQLVWTNLGALAANAGTNLIVTVTAPVAVGNLTNVASIGSPGNDPNPTNNTSSPVITAVTPIADLTIAKSGPAFVFANGNLSYTISVTNLGPSSANNVVVTDTLPASVNYVSASGGGVNTSGLVNWNLGSLATGQSSNLTVTVTAPLSGSLTNIANVSSPTIDTNILNNSTPPVVTVVTPVADLAIGKIAPASVFAASNLTYTISVTNFGPSTASSVTVTDSLPTGASFVSASGGGVSNSGNVVWNLGDLPNGAISNVTLTILAPVSGTLTNIATVGSPGGDPNSTNNITPPVLTTITPLADLVIAKFGPANVLAASNFNYTISITNLGPSAASSVVVTDALLTGAIFVSASGGGVNNSGIVNWSLGNLATGQSSNLTLTVTAPASGTLTNSANVSSPTGDTNILNNVTPPVITSVTPMADVSVVKFGPAGIIFGTNFNYTIAVSNAGPSTAASLSVTDNLPNGLVFIGAAPAASTNASNQVIWSLGNFAAGAASNLTLTVISTQRGSVTNLASGGSPTFDPMPTNNLTPPVVTVVTNNPPIANPDFYAITENTTNTFSPLPNDLVQTPGGNLTIVSLASTNGTVAILNGTNVVYVPANNFTGIVTIGYTITDNVGGTNSALIAISVTNRPPVANPDGYAITENTTNSFAVLVNDLVVTPGGSLTIISVAPTNGLATISGTNIVFVPATNFLGVATIGYTITDNVGGASSTIVTVLVTNLPPIANPDAYAVAENSTNTFAPLINDLLQTPGGTLQIIGVSPTNGAATILNLTNVAFTPSSNFVGTATIGYTITDNIGGTNSSVITVTVTNIPPTAFGQSRSTPENTVLPITLAGSDPANHPLTFVILSQPAGGTLTGLNTNTGAVIYTPTNNFTGTDTFTFRVNNGYNNSTTATVTIAVTPVADLVVAQSGPTSGVAGANLLFTVAVTNLGPASATNIVVTNQIDSGFTLVSASDGGSTNGNLVTWTVPVLPANGATNLTVTLLAIEGGTFTNIASGISVTPDLNSTNNNGSLTNAQVITTISALADVAVLKTGSASVLAGGSVNYSITATNFGPSTASNLVVRDTLPAGTTLQSASGNYSVSNNVIIWSPANLRGKATTNFTVAVTAPFGGTLTNVASSTSDTTDPNPTNNDGSSINSVVVTPVTPVADLAIGKSAAASVLATSNLVYTISVTNFGPSTASSVTVTDVLPATVSFMSASGGGVNNSGMVTWSLDNLASGAVSTVALTVAAPASGTLTNTASVGSPTSDPALTNNVTPPIITSVTPVADVAIGKRGPAGATFNTNFSYTISVTNFGPSVASGILVTDSLPVGVVFASANPATTTNTISQTIWSLGNLAAGATTNLTLNVVSTARGAITNVASVGAPTLDPSLTNNSSLPVVTLVTNIPPLANPDNYSIAENSGTNIFAPLLNDLVQNPGGSLQLISVSTTNGTAVISGTNVLFVPGTNYFGSLTINYSITDNVGGTNNSIINVLVTNIPPVANPDSYAVAENSSANILSPLVNDVAGTSGGILSLLGVNPTNGTVTISGTNVLFTPATNFLGLATIGYTITDGIGGTNTSLITVLVTNVPPLANPDSYAVTENTTNMLNPLVNDVVRTSGGMLSIIGVSPTNGTATILNLTNVVFTPTNNFLGVAMIGYTISDGIGGTSISLITVLATNLPPVANPDNYTVAENTTGTLSPLVNDLARTPGGVLNIIGVSPTNGTATILNLTNVVFTPATNFIGTTTISYTTTDNIGGTNSSLITVLVTNVPPLANPDSYAMAENTTNTFNPMVNDVVRTPGGVLSIIGVSPTNGTATILNLTNVVFTPTNNFLGTATIGYTITDGIGGTNSSVITILVTNLPPVANPDNYTVGENSGTSTLSPLINDSVRTPGGILNLVSVSPTNGSATISGTNVLFTPALNFFGLATIGYMITDGIGGTNSSLITVNVTNVPPVANGQSVSTPENVAVQITLTGSDPNSLPLKFGIVGYPANGTLSGLNTNTGIVTYTPGTNFTGTDSFTFRVNNGQTNSAPATVNITVSPVADLVVVESGPATGFAGSNLIFTVSVTNRGPANATSLAISNQLASKFTFVSASGGGVNFGNLITWNFASLPANGVTNFTVTAFATEGGAFTNIASGASAVLDLNPTNNNGSLASAQTLTMLTPVADLVVFMAGGTNVYAGGVVNYALIVSNAGPSTATSVVLQDALPAGTTLQNASGAYSVSNGVVIWSGFTLAPNATATFNLALIALPSVTSVLNVAQATSAVYDPNLANNNGSLGGSRVSTTVTPSADMIAAITGPTNAFLGSNIVFTLYLTNAGPSTASNIVASDNFPTNLVFVSASNSGNTNASHTIIWPAIASLPAGGVTNFTFTLKSLTLGFVTNIVSSTSVTFDPNPTNNTGVLAAAQAQTQITLPQFTILAGAPVFNPQTGLYEEQVTVTNTGVVTVEGIQLYVGNLRSGVSLYNASGTNGGVPFVQYNFPLDPGANVHFVLEFYDPLRTAFTNTLWVVPILASPQTMSGFSNSVPVNSVFTDTRTSPTRFVIEWSSVIGKTYTVIYADSLTATNWYVATPSITATANITQWYDDGPPKTISTPLSSGSRYYRVIKNN